MQYNKRLDKTKKILIKLYWEIRNYHDYVG